MNRVFLPLLLGSLSAVSAQTAQIAPKPAPVKYLDYSLVQSLVKTVTEAGKTVERLLPKPQVVQPGDQLHEAITVKNVFSRALRNVNVTGPVPAGTEFTGRLTPAGNRWKITYSIDGAKSFSAQPLRTVTVTEGGRQVQKQVPAPVNAYTHVRWTVTEMVPGESLNFFYRVKVK